MYPSAESVVAAAKRVLEWHCEGRRWVISRSASGVWWRFSEATFVDVLVVQVQRVAEGDPLFVVETEKVETEILRGRRPARCTGVVRSARCTNIGAEIGVIRPPG